MLHLETTKNKYNNMMMRSKENNLSRAMNNYKWMTNKCRKVIKENKMKKLEKMNKKANKEINTIKNKTIMKKMRMRMKTKTKMKNKVMNKIINKLITQMRSNRMSLQVKFKMMKISRDNKISKQILNNKKQMVMFLNLMSNKIKMSISASLV